MKRRVPRAAVWLLHKFGVSPYIDELAGDLAEQFEQGRSTVWYWKEVVIAIAAGVALRMESNIAGSDNGPLALWLAPLVASLPIISLFALPFSPLYLGKLMNDPTHPMNWPWLGPLISGMGVVFDSTVLGYVIIICFAYPILVVLKRRGRLTVVSVLFLFMSSGIVASQVVRVLQHFSQPGLRAFATSWQSPFLGSLCGLCSGVFFFLIAKRRLSENVSGLLYLLPVAILTSIAVSMPLIAVFWRAHAH